MKSIWKEKLKNTIIKCGLESKETYHMSMRIGFELEYYFDRKKKIQTYYNKSLDGLIDYMKKDKTNPNENVWNHYALPKGYLSSKSIGYIYGDGFNTLCRRIRKGINNKLY